jgi:hypothetical protein
LWKQREKLANELSKKGERKLESENKREILNITEGSK